MEITAPIPVDDPTSPLGDPESAKAWLAAHARPDTLYQAMLESVSSPDPPASMFEKPVERPPPIGVKVEGLKPMFRAATVDIKLGASGAWPDAVLRVSVYRYWPGPMGNRGWIDVMRTGPGDFGAALLGMWKIRYQIPFGKQASAGGYLRDQYGKPVPTETEEDVFSRLGCAWIPPDRRELWLRHRAGAA